MTQAIKHHIRNRHHNKNKSSSELKMCDLEWPGIPETVRKVSQEKGCDSSQNCKIWDEIKRTAWCRASKILKALPEGNQISYVSTDFKTEAQGDWAQFTFLNKPQQQNGNDEKGYLYKVCVPVDQSKQSWASDKCISTQCGPMGTKKQLIQENQDPNCQDSGETQLKLGLPPSLNLSLAVTKS